MMHKAMPEKKGFWMFCTCCKMYAHTPAEAREHAVATRDMTPEQAMDQWPDDVKVAC